MEPKYSAAAALPAQSLLQRRGRSAATWLCAWWQRVLQDDESRYICNADDLAHLERRLRAVERGQWRSPDGWSLHG
jgi:hypothetical protein